MTVLDVDCSNKMSARRRVIPRAFLDDDGDESNNARNSRLKQFDEANGGPSTTQATSSKLATFSEKRDQHQTTESYFTTNVPNVDSDAIVCDGNQHQPQLSKEKSASTTNSLSRSRSRYRKSNILDHQAMASPAAPPPPMPIFQHSDLSSEYRNADTNANVDGNVKVGGGTFASRVANGRSNADNAEERQMLSSSDSNVSNHSIGIIRYDNDAKFQKLRNLGHAVENGTIKTIKVNVSKDMCLEMNVSSEHTVRMVLNDGCKSDKLILRGAAVLVEKLPDRGLQRYMHEAEVLMDILDGSDQFDRKEFSIIVDPEKAASLQINASGQPLIRPPTLTEGFYYGTGRHPRFHRTKRYFHLDESRLIMSKKKFAGSDDFKNAEIVGHMLDYGVFTTIDLTQPLSFKTPEKYNIVLKPLSRRNQFDGRWESFFFLSTKDITVYLNWVKAFTNWRSFSLDQQRSSSNGEKNHTSELTPASLQNNSKNPAAFNTLHTLAPSLPALDNFNHGKLDFGPSSGMSTPRQQVRRELTKESSFSSEYEPSPERHAQTHTQNVHKRGKSLNLLNGFRDRSGTHDEAGIRNMERSEEAGSHSRKLLKKHRPHPSHSQDKDSSSNVSPDKESHSHSRSGQISDIKHNHRLHNKNSDLHDKPRPTRPIVHIPSSSDDDDDVPLAFLQHKSSAMSLDDDTPLAYFDASPKHTTTNVTTEPIPKSNKRYHKKPSATNKTPAANDTPTPSDSPPKKLVNLTEDDYYYANIASRRPRGQGFTPSADSPGPLISHATQPYGALPELALLSAAIPTRIQHTTNNHHHNKRNQKNNNHMSPQDDANSPYTADSLLANLPESKSAKTGLNKGIMGQDEKRTLMDMETKSRYVPGSLLEQHERVTGGSAVYRKVLERA